MAPIAGISAEDLGNAISKKVALNVRVSSEAELLDNLQKETTSDALVLCQGAGSVSRICRDLFSSFDDNSYV